MKTTSQKNIELATFISHLLYKEDIMGTCCLVNKNTDEYDTEASHIAKHLRLGIPFKTALHDIFSFFFWEGCLIPSAKAVACIEAQYYNYVSKTDL
jgi:hypothetical protein